jgi:hypothetical protein
MTYIPFEFNIRLSLFFFLLQLLLDPKQVHPQPKEATTTTAAPMAELNLPMAITWVRSIFFF